MKTSWMFRTQVLALVVGLLFCANAAAQNVGTAAEKQEQAGKDVQAELATIRAELKAVRGDLQKVLAELQAVKAAQGTQQRQPRQRQNDTTVYDIDLTGAPIRGPKDAKVTIVEYVDFQCPYCVGEAPVIKEVMDTYPNDVRWVFKHFPLGFHKKAKPAHAAAALAMKHKGDDGFWQMHDLILANNKKIDVADLRGHAETVGVDLAEFDEVMADPAKIDALLEKDMTGAGNYGVRGTPSVFVNGLRLSPRKLENYKARIDEILQGKGKEAAKPAVAIKKATIKGGN